MEFSAFLLGGIVAYAMSEDRKTFLVPDWVSAFAWMVFAVFFSPGAHSLAAFLFGVSLFVKVSADRMKKGAVFGWADVMWLPLIFSSLTDMVGAPNAVFLFFISTVWAGIVERIEKKGQPLIFFWGLGFLLGLVFESAMSFLSLFP